MLRGVIVPIAIFIDCISTFSSRVIKAVVLGTLVTVACTVFPSIPIVFWDFDVGSSSPTAFTRTGETMTATVTWQIGFTDSSSSGSSKDRLWSCERACITAFLAFMQDWSLALEQASTRRGTHNQETDSSTMSA
jgi:hypothetical protein